MTRLELIGMRKFLLDHSMEWFDPRSPRENMEAHAWRAIAYYFAGVEGNEALSESIERSNALLDKINPSVPNIM
jgi:hypothetical protein